MTRLARLSSQMRRDYRLLYRAGLYAVRYSNPARTHLREILQDAFRKGEATNYDGKRVANTVEFLENAGRAPGVEHKILRNLLMLAYWRKKNTGQPR